MHASADVGISGLGTMGRNLARNIARHGYTVAVHNRSLERTRSLVADHGDEGAFVPCESLESLVASLGQPRTVIVLVRAGEATDAVIDSLAALLSDGDVIVDAGNGHFADTRRRAQRLAQAGLHLVGAGVSGGGEGALFGPSIMVGGSATSYEIVGPLLEAISARVGDEPCCARVGPDSAGHFVKMVHNGIEYAVMQLIAEAYDVMRHRLGLAPEVIGDVFAEWATGELGSFLVEITARVLRHTDEVSGQPLIDVVLDQAGQKGTGRWSVQTALDLGVPATAIAEATLARALSSSLAQRESARERLTGAALDADPVDPHDGVEDVRRALYAATLVAYSQGFEIIAAASREYDWDLDRPAGAPPSSRGGNATTAPVPVGAGVTADVGPIAASPQVRFGRPSSVIVNGSLVGGAFATLPHARSRPPVAIAGTSRERRPLPGDDVRSAMTDHDPESERLTIRRTLSAEPTVVRGLLHELAQTGEWTGLSDPGDQPVEIHVEDGGAGSAVIEVSQQASPDQREQMGAALAQAVDELERRLVERTTDAS